MFNKLEIFAIISLFVVSFLLMPIHGMEEDYNDWEIVPSHSKVNNNDVSSYSGNNADDYNVEDDFELKAKAFGNTAITLIEGAGMTILNVGLNIVEERMRNNARQVDAWVELGSAFVGNLYGQGLALQQAYENEKETLRESK